MSRIDATSDGGDEGSDDVDWEQLQYALRDGDGSIQFGNVLTAARHELSVRDGLLFLAVAGLFAVDILTTTDPVSPVVVVGSLLFLAGAMVFAAVRDFYEDDEEVAIKALRDRYAADEIDFEEFQRKVDRVIAGEDVGVFDDEGDSETDEVSSATETGRDPAAILRERYARGDIDDAEFERRLSRLEDSADATSPERLEDGKEAFEK